MVSSSSKTSNAAIDMMWLKKSAALAGIEIWKSGIITISCCVLIIDQRCCREAARSKLSRKFDARTTFEAPATDSIPA